MKKIIQILSCLVVIGILSAVSISILASAAKTDIVQGEYSEGVDDSGTYIDTAINVLPDGTIQTTIPQEPEFVPGELIVKFKPTAKIVKTITKNGIANVGLESIDALNEKHKVKSWGKVFKTAKKPKVATKKVPDLSNIYLLTLPKDADVLSVAEKYNENANVEYAEPNYIAHICVTPDDPYYSQQWAHQNMQSEQAWDIETGDPSVAIAIVDTGVDWNHPDLAANIWANPGEIAGNGIDDDGNGYIDDIRGWDFVNFDSDPMDDNGHGTHCSGIAAAETNNGVGVAGVCWNCAIMPVKTFNSRGIGTWADISRGIVYAAQNDVDVISMSFGAMWAYSRTGKDAVDYAYGNGVVLVAGAGNDAYDILFYPAAFDNVIAVSATDDSDQFWVVVEYVLGSNYGSWIDVAAPGVDIFSTYWDNTYTYLTGTSMSTPYVAGLAGLILSRNPGFTNGEVRHILRQSADDLGDAGWDQYYGYGRLNAYQAIQITTPPPTAMLSTPRTYTRVKGEIVDIVGTVSAVNFQNYVVEVGLGVEPTSWQTTGITLTDGGTSPIIDGTLATWDTSTPSEDGFWTIRLTVNSINTDSSEDRVTVVVDCALQDGWPQTTFGKMDRSPVLGDIDGDGNLEVVAGCRDGRVYAWHHDGTPVNGWPRTTGGGVGATPAIADIDGDGDLEVVVGSTDRRVHAWHGDGSPVSGWPVYVGVNVFTPAIADLDGDGDVEILVGSSDTDYKVYAWHHDGSMVSGWPQATGGWVFAPPALGDIDGDGDLEVVVGSMDRKVYAWHHDGATVDGWPQATGGAFYDFKVVTLADLDADGDLEVVAASNKIYAWHHDGTTVDGWPIGWPVVSGISGGPSLGDIDDDGDVEILIGTVHHVHAFHHDGSSVIGWPQKVGSFPRVPVIGDIDGDSDVEVIVGGAGDMRVYAWHHDGTVVSGWPKIADTVQSTPALGDIDKDGDVEVVVFPYYPPEYNGWPEYNVYVWDLLGTYDPANVEWGTYQHDTWHTGLYGFVPSVNDGITLEVTPIDNEVIPGETATYEVSVSYFMDDPPTEHVVLSIDNSIWSYTFDPAEFDITSGESKYSTLSINVPTNTQPGTYEHTVNATATGQIGPVTITEWVTTDVETEVIPEFTTIAIPVAVIFGLILLIRRRKRH